MALESLGKALNHKCFVKVCEGTTFYFITATLLVDDTHAYIFTDCEVGNPVSAPGVGGNVPLVTVDLG